MPSTTRVVGRSGSKTCTGTSPGHLVIEPSAGSCGRSDALVASPDAARLEAAIFHVRIELLLCEALPQFRSYSTGRRSRYPTPCSRRSRLREKRVQRLRRIEAASRCGLIWFISSFLWSTGCVVGTSLGASAQWHNGSHAPPWRATLRDVTGGRTRGLGVSASRSTRSTPDRRWPDRDRPVGCSAAGSSPDPPVRPVSSRMRRRTHRSRWAPGRTSTPAPAA